MAGRMVTTRVEGLDSVLKKLNKLPERNRRHVMRPAISKASTPVVKAAKRFAPEGAGLTPSGKPRKKLKKTITKTSVKWYREKDVFAITVGPEKNASPHSHLVHNGTKPHLIRFTKHVFLNGVPVIFPGQVILHPGAKANPFLSNAVEATRGKSQEILKKAVLAGIDKQVQKLRKTK